MPDLPKTLVKLAAEFVKHQGKKHFGERFLVTASETLTEFAGDTVTEKITNFVDQGERAKKLLEAFTEADKCFAEKCGDDLLKQAIAMLPLRETPSLEKLAAALPETLDDEGLLAALKTRFKEDWGAALTEAQLNQAAKVYRDCLDRPLAAKCDQLLETLLRKVDRIEQSTQHIEATTQELLSGQKEIKTALLDAASISQLGPREWLRPPALLPSRPMVGRLAEFDEVRRFLKPGARAAITAMHGTPGVGKTLLAEHLAAELDSQFSGGVLSQGIGSGFRDPGLCAPILDRWAAFAFNGRKLPEGTHFTPEAVRALLAGHGSLLVVLDDIWDLKALLPFREALPGEACLLITTRNERLAHELHGETYNLDVLTEEDAKALLRQRMRKATEADEPLVETLAKALGRHAMALDIAGSGLGRLSRLQWPDGVSEMARQVREGSGFGEIHLPGEEVRVNAVEVALSVSYHDLSAEAQKRFRVLGAFAPDAGFRVEAAAGLWACPPDEAEAQLIDFAERGLLTRIDSPLPVGEPRERGASHGPGGEVATTLPPPRLRPRPIARRRRRRGRPRTARRSPQRTHA